MPRLDEPVEPRLVRPEVVRLELVRPDVAVALTGPMLACPVPADAAARPQTSQ